MFYSRNFLSRKGPLGSIWVAAYCFKRLKKTQVFQTDISSSVGQFYLFQLSVFVFLFVFFFLARMGEHDTKVFVFIDMVSLK